MLPAPKKRKASEENDCHGDGCGQLSCTSYLQDLGDIDPFLAGLTGIGQFVRPDRRRSAGQSPNPSASRSRPRARRDNKSGGAKCARKYGTSSLGESSGSAQPQPSTSAAASVPRLGVSAAAAAANAVVVPAGLEQMVAELDPETLRKLIVDIAPNNPQLLRSIGDAHRKRKTRPSPARGAPASWPALQGLAESSPMQSSRGSSSSNKPKRSAPLRAIKPEPQPYAPQNRTHRAVDTVSTPTPNRQAMRLSQMVPAIDFGHLSKDA